MKVLGLIPARGGSKGIPGKNIKNLGNKPLLAYTADSAFQSRLLHHYILSSDDSDIIAYARSIGLEAPFVRPSELALDSTPSLDVVLHALGFYKEKDIYFDAVCLLQPTTPFRSKTLIDDAIRDFSEKDLDSLISVRKVPEEYNPHWVFEEKNGELKLSTGEQEIIPRRQDLPKAYHRDGAIYLTKTNVLEEQRSLYGKKIGFIDTTGDPYVNIDTMKDWEKAEKLLTMNNKP